MLETSKSSRETVEARDQPQDAQRESRLASRDGNDGEGKRDEFASKSFEADGKESGRIRDDFEKSQGRDDKQEDARLEAKEQADSKPEEKDEGARLEANEQSQEQQRDEMEGARLESKADDGERTGASGSSDSGEDRPGDNEQGRDLSRESVHSSAQEQRDAYLESRREEERMTELSYCSLR